MAAGGPPGGLVDHDFYRSISGELLAAVESERPDAIALELHGAMATPECRDVEGDLLTRLNRDDADARLVASAKPSLIWCPYGTLQMMGSRDAKSRMVELERAGSAVALATDIPRAVDFDGIAGLAVGCAAACGQALDPWRLFAMRTRHAASSVGANRLCGQLAAGLSADIVIEKPDDLIVDSGWEVAVLSGRRTVRHVMVAGRRVFSDGQCLTADGERIRAQAKTSAQAILSRIEA